MYVHQYMHKCSIFCLVEPSGHDEAVVNNNNANEQAAHEDSTTAPSAITTQVNELKHSTSDVQQLKVITAIDMLLNTISLTATI